MTDTVLVRRYRAGEEPALFEVYHSAVHMIASRDYSPEQVAAWAPDGLDAALWANRIRGINPFVAEIDGVVVAYADLQSSGYIDHFFVSGAHPRRGLGAMLMRRILEEAEHLGLSELTSDVSRTAQGFYERYGFRVVEHRSPVVRGVVLPNALMRLELKNA
jgi:putative acetyltransferase